MRCGLRAWVRRRPLTAFFAFTFVYSWWVYLPGVLQGLEVVELGLGQAAYTVLNVVGGFGPSLAAVAVTRLTGGWGGVKALLRRGVDVRGMSLRWWLIAILIFPALNLASIAVNYTLTRALPETNFPGGPLDVLLYLLAFLLPVGNHWREEYGWRGYALPAMQERHGALMASVALGLAWGVWHVPLFFFPTTQAVYGRIGVVSYLVMVVLLSCVMTWVYNGSGGRLFTAMVCHFLAGALDYFVVKTSTAYGLLIYIALEVALLAAVVLRYGPERMAQEVAG